MTQLHKRCFKVGANILSIGYTNQLLKSFDCWQSDAMRKSIDMPYHTAIIFIFSLVTVVVVIETNSLLCLNWNCMQHGNRLIKRQLRIKFMWWLDASITGQKQPIQKLTSEFLSLSPSIFQKNSMWRIKKWDEYDSSYDWEMEEFQCWILYEDSVLHLHTYPMHCN